MRGISIIKHFISIRVLYLRCCEFLAMRLIRTAMPTAERSNREVKLRRRCQQFKSPSHLRLSFPFSKLHELIK